MAHSEATGTILAGEGDRLVLAAVFDGLNGYLGNFIGEFLGELGYSVFVTPPRVRRGRRL